MYDKKLNATFLVKKRKLVVKIYIELLKVDLFTELFYLFLHIRGSVTYIYRFVHTFVILGLVCSKKEDSRNISLSVRVFFFFRIVGTAF